MEEKILIRKVWRAKSSNQLHVIIPKNRGIDEGDYVSIRKFKVVEE